MKKGLLFALSLGITSWAIGQSVNSVHKVNTNQSGEQFADKEVAYVPTKNNTNLAAKPIFKKSASSKSISIAQLSSSANVYGYLVEQCSPLTVNEDIGVIHFTHRGDPAVSGGTSSGDIISSQSRDGGDTWTSNMAFPNATGYNNRYPGGVLYNPTGNTVADSAFIVVFGPSHDGVSSNVWQHAFLGSMQLNNTIISHDYLPTYGALPRMGLQSTSDGKFHVMGTNYTATPYSLDTIKVYEGVWNVNKKNVDWTVTKFQENFVVDGDGDMGIYSAFNTAWSADGMTGYFWSVGRDVTNDLRSYQPIVWKTTDAGANWAKMPIFDFGSLTTITDYLQPMKTPSANYARPSFGGSNDGTVDANGNLHIIARVAAASSDHNDSLGYSFYFANASLSNPIFDIFTTATGWDAVHLGDVTTVAVDAANSGYGSGTDAIGWDLRLQAGRTADGTKVFATWTDTDTALGSAILDPSGFPQDLFPDIVAVGYDVVTGKQTQAVNFTKGTGPEGDCFFHYMSDIVLSDNGTYTIPVAELDLGTTPLDVVTIQYLKGISFVEADFTTSTIGVSEINKNNISVSQNRPNPFNGTSQIDVNLNKSANVSIEIINITGQKVYTENYGTLSTGTHTVTISSNNLTSGIYFYTVQAGNTSVTKKMIVE